MSMLFALAFAAGLALLITLPIPKDRTRRMVARSASAALFAVGLVGLVYRVFAA